MLQGVKLNFSCGCQVVISEKFSATRWQNLVCKTVGKNFNEFDKNNNSSNILLSLQTWTYFHSWPLSFSKGMSVNLTRQTISYT